MSNFKTRKLNTFCSTSLEIIQEVTQFNDAVIGRNNFAVFVPELVYKKFKMLNSIRRQFIADEHIWDYNLQIGDTITKMKLIWITNGSDIKTLPDLKLKKAFSFLQPNFLCYMDKPFWNPNVITQVNLVLDYHRRQKRENANEIFNICDLVNFKMAIDDNRYEYENCEFHKIIDRSLAEHVKNNKYVQHGLFSFNKYFEDINNYARPCWEIFEYVVYHFQKTMASNFIQYYPHTINLTLLSDISNILLFMKTYATNDTMFQISNTDPNGKCSEILYESMTKIDMRVKLEYKTDGEWFYSGDNRLKSINNSLARENFINWLKLSFGEHSKHLDLEISTTSTINPYIFNNFYVNYLHLGHVALTDKLVKMLKLCKYRKITFYLCTIENDLDERFDLLVRQPKTTNNVFEHLEELQNVEYIDLKYDNSAILMLFTYVSYVMMKKNLMRLKLRNKIIFRVLGMDYIYEFRRFNVNTVVDQIEAFNEFGAKIHFEKLFELGYMCERESFDFYD